MTKEQRLEQCGVVFGLVTVAVDPAQGDAVLRFNVRGKIVPFPKVLHLHNIDELRGLYSAHAKDAGKGVQLSIDMRRAVKFAGQSIQSHQTRKRKPRR